MTDALTKESLSDLCEPSHLPSSHLSPTKLELHKVAEATLPIVPEACEVGRFQLRNISVPSKWLKVSAGEIFPWYRVMPKKREELGHPRPRRTANSEYVTQKAEMGRRQKRRALGGL